MKRRTMNASGRDLFSSHKVNAGKGDKARHVFNASWRSNYDGINFSSAIAWTRKEGRKLVKVYGVIAASFKEISL